MPEIYLPEDIFTFPCEMMGNNTPRYCPKQAVNEAKHSRNGEAWAWASKVKTLRQFEANFGARFSLSIFFNAFSKRGNSKVPNHENQRLHHRAMFFRTSVNITYQRNIELQNFGRYFNQIKNACLPSPVASRASAVQPSRLT
jgi:hypothetical protein